MRTFITTVLKEYLKANNLPTVVFSFRSAIALEELPTLMMGTFMKYDCGIFPIDFLIDEKTQVLRIYTILPLHGILEIRDKVSELIYELNLHIQSGMFSINDSNGQVRFETRHNFADREPTVENIEELIRVNLNVMVHYISAFIWVMFTEASAEEALKQLNDPENVLGLYRTMM